MPNYFFHEPFGPTQLSLSMAFERKGWQQNSSSCLFNNENLLSDQLLQLFEYKHLFHRWLIQNQLDFAPKTWILDELTLHKTIKSLEKYSSTTRWIIKPSLLNNGQGITIASGGAQVADYFKQSNRFSGIHTIQQYIEPPMLWGDRKFSLRMFVVLSLNGMYLHPDGYINVCNEIYCPDDTSKLSAHLTNEHLHSTGKKNNQQIVTGSWQNFEKYMLEINRQCRQVFLPFCQNEVLTDKAFAILGVDFMLDFNERLWILEVNHGPCFPTDDSHPLFNTLYVPFWDKVVELISSDISAY